MGPSCPTPTTPPGRWRRPVCGGRWSRMQQPTASATAHRPGSSTVGVELRLAGRQLWDAARESVTTLRWAHRSSWRVTVLSIWFVGIVLDAVTTYVMMRQPVYEEANPAAAAGMAVIGVGGYVLAASLAS